MSFADYCLLRDCPVTNPRPRCERDVTVAGSVLEILRREPDVFVRTAPDWLGEWLRKLRRVAGHVQTDEFASEETY